MQGRLQIHAEEPVEAELSILFAVDLRYRPDPRPIPREEDVDMDSVAPANEDMARRAVDNRIRSRSKPIVKSMDGQGYMGSAMRDCIWLRRAGHAPALFRPP